MKVRVLAHLEYEAEQSTYSFAKTVDIPFVPEIGSLLTLSVGKDGRFTFRVRECHWSGTATMGVAAITINTENESLEDVGLWLLVFSKDPNWENWDGHKVPELRTLPTE